MNKRGRGRDVQCDDEREVERLALRLCVHEVVPPDPRREEHRVPQARDREELGHTLQHADDRGAE